jgi:hypothetical protein
MVIHTKLQKALYDWDGRKYIELEGIGRVKVPFRYGRIMCKVLGDKTVQEMEVGLSVEVYIDIKTWDGVQHRVLFSIKEI